ncbi:serine/arginine-rich splicing factor SC35-like protein [Tanacetum coccineum]|uniref:Serine/arginine-rich splicing factor SC35-like protein n=1 Tax=Tanacetum coccineum TaxID=301880 RepID=A0ABQ4Z4Y2_9ASTR
MSMSAPAKLTYLRVLQVDPSTTEYELFRLFDTYGTVDTLFTPTDRKRQFAFVSYKLAKDAKDAQYEIDGTTVGGRAISVQISEHGPDKDPLCNTMRDMARKYRDEIFPLPEQEQRRTRPNKINRYTRSDYAAEEEAADGKKENAATERVEEREANVDC